MTQPPEEIVILWGREVDTVVCPYGLWFRLFDEYGLNISPGMYPTGKDLDDLYNARFTRTRTPSR